MHSVLHVQEVDGVLGLLKTRKEALGEADCPWGLRQNRRRELVGVADKDDLRKFPRQKDHLSEICR